jgi:glucosamine-6-phosphate deaminase
MPKKQLFSVGDLCLDVLQEISKKMKFGEEHSLKDLDFSIGGNSANFAVIASKLGLKPKLISAIGRDFATGFLEKELSKSRVEHSLIRSRQPNAFSVISVNRRGERAIQSVKNCENEVTAKRVARLLLPKLKDQDMVFFGGFYHLRKLRPGFSSLLRKIKAKGAVVCFDTSFDTHNVWKIDGFLPFIDYLFVNDIELRHIARGKTMQHSVNKLFRKGARVVVVKQASKGATLFVKGFKPTSFASLKPKVVDTTGAGDAFNAGFVFGLMNGWSLDNCMRTGNFVAAKKIQVHGLAGPKPSAIERFIGINNKPTLVVVRNYDEMSRLAAQRVINLLKRKPNASFLLPTGATPEKLYRLLVKAYKKKQVSFAKASFFNLDDYVGLSQEDKASFAFFLQKRLFKKINAKKENIHLLDGSAKNLKAEATKHEAAIKRKGIDLCFLGIAPNGHIAFNEPGCCPYSITRVVRLKDATRKKNAKDFHGKPVPKKGITVGIRTIRDNSKKIILLASGKNKARAVRASLKSKNFMLWPAVSLKQHKNFMFIVDRKAAKKRS